MSYSENISDICRVGDYYDGQHDACTVAKCECDCHMELAAETPDYWWVDYDTR